MGIRFNCQHCGKTLNVKSSLGGKRGLCPHCQGKITIPEESSENSTTGEATVSAAGTQTAPAPASTTKAPPAKPPAPVATAPVVATSAPPTVAPVAVATPVGVAPTPVASPAAVAEPVAQVATLVSAAAALATPVATPVAAVPVAASAAPVAAPVAAPIATPVAIAAPMDFSIDIDAAPTIRRRPASTASLVVIGVLCVAVAVLSYFVFQVIRDSATSGEKSTGAAKESKP